jgi:transposase, IS5 family
MLNVVNEYLAQCDVRISTGTIVDATIIHALSSTKNQEGKRDPEMHQMKKGNQWYFGMKAHVGVDSKESIVHSAEATAANIADSKMLLEYCTATSARYGGTQPIRGRARRYAPRLPTLRISVWLCPPEIVVQQNAIRAIPLRHNTVWLSTL